MGEVRDNLVKFRCTVEREIFEVSEELRIFSMKLSSSTRPNSSSLSTEILGLPFPFLRSRFPLSLRLLLSRDFSIVHRISVEYDEFISVLPEQMQFHDNFSESGPFPAR